jgi:hypothetical protein
MRRRSSRTSSCGRDESTTRKARGLGARRARYAARTRSVNARSSRSNLSSVRPWLLGAREPAARHRRRHVEQDRAVGTAVVVHALLERAISAASTPWPPPWYAQVASV